MSKAGLEEGRCRVGARYGGGYVIERLFARGGMAELYVANHEITRRQVAFKVLNRRYAQEPNIVRRAEQEARALAEIDHPNVVKILDAGTDPEVGLFIAMELLDGKSVREVLARVERLPLPQALTIAIEIAEATHGLHQLGIFHRDIKPDNVFVCRPADGRFCLKLLDLGAAKVPKYGLPTTTVGQTIGTARYMSPEHIQRGEITAASDQYALAHMLYEMLTGWHPFSSDIAQPSYVELCAWHLFAEPVGLERRLADCPPLLSEIVARAMAKKPSERFGSMLAFADALRDVLRQIPGDPAVRGLSAQAPAPTAVALAPSAAAEAAGRAIDTAATEPRAAPLGQRARAGEATASIGPPVVWPGAALHAPAVLDRPLALPPAGASGAGAGAGALAQAPGPGRGPAGTLIVQLEQVLQLAREPAPAAHGRARAAEAAAPRLVVEETPDESLPVGTLFELGRQNVAICWADPSGIAIDDPRLKAQEFVLVWRGQQHMLVPRFLPVEVNGTLVRDAVALDGTALIRAGATALVYRLGDPPWQAPLRLRPGDRDRAHLVMERCTASRRALLAEPRLVIEHGSCQGRSFALPYSAVTIGVHPEADLCLDDPEAALVAAVVTVEQGRVWISQVGTSPQPRINGQSRERQRLRSGDRIALGATVLRYELARLPATAELDAAAKPAPTQEGSANAAPLQDALPAGQQVAVSVGSRWQKVAAWARSNRRLVLPLVLLASIALLLAWLWRSGCGPGAVRRAGSPSPALGSLER